MLSEPDIRSMWNATRRMMFLCMLLLAAPTVMAQGGIGQKQQERIQAKKEKEEKKAKAKKAKEDRRRHLSNQDKATRKRMKRNGKRADRHGKSTHREPFLRRLFGADH